MTSSVGMEQEHEQQRRTLHLIGASLPVVTMAQEDNPWQTMVKGDEQPWKPEADHSVCHSYNWTQEGADSLEGSSFPF